MLIVEVVATLAYLLLDLPTRAVLDHWLVASGSQVFFHGKVWTLLTTSLFELDFIALIVGCLMLWMFVPTLERFWGTSRFYRFVLVSSVAGNLVGCAIGLAVAPDMPVAGFSPMIWGSIVAFGILYARQPVQFSYYLHVTGRQLMIGFIVVLSLYVLLGQQWVKGASFAGGMICAAVMTSKRWSPGLAWRKWRIARARARLAVIEGGQKTPPKRDEKRWLN